MDYVHAHNPLFRYTTKTGIMLFILTLILVAVMGAIIWDRHHGFYRDVRFWISLVCLGFLIGFGASHYW